MTQRLGVLHLSESKATVILFAGGHGGLQISRSGSFRWDAGNFLVPPRPLFTRSGIDGCSDRLAIRSSKRTVSLAATARRASTLPISRLSLRRQHEPRPRFRYGLWARAAVLNPWRSSPRSSADPRVRTESCSHRRSSPMTKVGLFLRCRSKSYAFLCWWSTTNRMVAGACAFRDIPPLMSKLGDAPRTKLLSFTGGEGRGDP